MGLHCTALSTYSSLIDSKFCSQDARQPQQLSTYTNRMNITATRHRGTNSAPDVKERYLHLIRQRSLS